MYVFLSCVKRCLRKSRFIKLFTWAHWSVSHQQWIFQTCGSTATDLIMLLFTQYETIRGLPLPAVSPSRYISCQDISVQQSHAGSHSVISNKPRLHSETNWYSYNKNRSSPAWGQWYPAPPFHVWLPCCCIHPALYLKMLWFLAPPAKSWRRVWIQTHKIYFTNKNMWVCLFDLKRYQILI